MPACRVSSTKESVGVDSWALGEGSNDEEALSKVGRSDIGSSKAHPASHVPCFGQVGEDDSEGSKEAWDILHDDDSGSKNANGSRHLVPELRSGAGEEEPLSGVGEVGAGEASGEDIGRL